MKADRIEWYICECPCGCNSGAEFRVRGYRVRGAGAVLWARYVRSVLFTRWRWSCSDCAAHHAARFIGGESR